MPSTKLVNALRSKSAFSEEEIGRMSDGEGWNWIYANTISKKSKRGSSQICFTGFSVSEKARLVEKADSCGLQVVGSITKSLSYLCVGPHPGEAKLAKAAQQGVCTMSEAEFLEFVVTGELPEAS